MFTGIISDVGQVIEMTPHGELSRLVLASAYDPETIALGASIAINGVCLTVVEAAPGQVSGARARVRRRRGDAEVTTLGRLKAATGSISNARCGSATNSAVTWSAAMSTASRRLFSRRDFDGMAHFRFRAPRPLAKFIATKGSVALEGTSLTVNAVEGDAFEVLLIPHTLAVTAWGALKAGDRVNIEVDQMARYAARLIEAGSQRPATPKSELSAPAG